MMSTASASSGSTPGSGSAAARTDGTNAARRTVSVVLFQGFELLDVFGPAELFGMVPGLAVEYAGPGVGPVASSQGVRVVAERTHDDLLGGSDILLVPGGRGTRPLATDAAFLSWLRLAADRAQVVASVCTGSALLAAAGVLDGHRATGNKRAWTWATGLRPAVHWQATARWVHDGRIWTSSGVSAGMDMARALIADQWGEEVAREAADRAEYVAHLDSADDPFAAAAGLC